MNAITQQVAETQLNSSCHTRFQLRNSPFLLSLFLCIILALFQRAALDVTKRLKCTRSQLHCHLLTATISAAGPGCCHFYCVLICHWRSIALFWNALKILKRCFIVRALFESVFPIPGRLCVPRVNHSITPLFLQYLAIKYINSRILTCILYKRPRASVRLVTLFSLRNHFILTKATLWRHNKQRFTRRFCALSHDKWKEPVLCTLFGKGLLGVHWLLPP